MRLAICLVRMERRRAKDVLIPSSQQMRLGGHVAHVTSRVVPINNAMTACPITPPSPLEHLLSSYSRLAAPLMWHELHLTCRTAANVANIGIQPEAYIICQALAPLAGILVAAVRSLAVPSKDKLPGRGIEGTATGNNIEAAMKQKCS